MKLKNISIVEKHVDKIAIGIAAIFLLYVVWAYFLNNRFSVDLAGVQTPPGEIDNSIAAKARTLESRLNGSAPKELTDWKSPDYSGLFTKTLVTPPTPPAADGSVDHLKVAIFTGDQLNSETRVTVTDPTGQPHAVDNSNPPYDIPVIPTPASLVVRTDLGTLDTTANSLEILKSFGSQQPLDIQWVTVAARIDMSKLTAQLSAPPAADKQRIRPDLWAGKAALIDVQVERRMLNDDGSWSDPVLVPPMVGRFSVRNAINQVTVSTAPTTIEAAQANQSQIVQPTFYALRNTAWLPPELPAESASSTGTPADPAALADLRRRLDETNAIIARRTQELQQAGNNPTRQRQLENIINVLKGTAASLTRQIQAAGGTAPATPVNPNPNPTYPGAMPGGMPPGFPGGPDFSPEYAPFNQPGAAPSQQQPGYQQITGSLMAQDSFECWANDFSIQPGKTYQYRMRITFSNPLYRQPGIPDSQKDLFNQFTLNSEWSDWSQSITSIKSSYFFVVSGNVANHSARMEIWKFYDGLWRKSEDNVSPGDPIGKPTNLYTAFGAAAAASPQPATDPSLIAGPQQVIDFSTGAVLVDTDFAYKVLLPSLNIPQTTLRILYVTEGHLASRTEAADKEQRNALLKQIAPDSTAGADNSDIELRRAYKERLDRERAERAGRAPTRTPTSDRIPRGGPMAPDEFLPGRN